MPRPGSAGCAGRHTCNIQSHHGPSAAPSQVLPQKTHELPLKVPVVRCDEQLQTAYFGACSGQMLGCPLSTYACRMLGSHALWVGEVLARSDSIVSAARHMSVPALPRLALLCTGRGGDLG